MTIAASLTLALLCGCGGSDEDNIKLVPVSGTITLNGKPMAGAKVTFNPSAENKDSTVGVDETGPEGNYKLKFKSRSGIAPGKYTVIVEPALVVDMAKVPEAFKDDPYMARIGAEAAAGVTAKKKSTPAGEKSEFPAEVDDRGGSFDFDVKTSSKATK